MSENERQDLIRYSDVKRDHIHAFYELKLIRLKHWLQDMHRRIHHRLESSATSNCNWSVLQTSTW